jgi:hypothetical protein
MTTSKRIQASDKSVRDLPVKAKLKVGQIVVENSNCGILFSFPAAVWPKNKLQRLQWICRLTPWWDMTASDWTPQCQRLRESCIKAIDKLFERGASAPETANDPAMDASTENGEGERSDRPALNHFASLDISV